jgi:hypothetical protein
MYRKGLSRRLQLGIGVALLALVVSGCASSAPSALVVSQIQEARAALARAEDAGAREHAPILLRDAEDKIEEAGEVHRRSKGVVSRRLLEAARADAELAEHTARAAKAQAAADEIQQSIRILREETLRGRDN